MNKHSLITIIAIIAIIIPFVYSGMNLYAAEQLKYKWSQPDEFGFFDVLNEGIIELCNTVPYPANLKNFQITIWYEGKNKGVYHIDNITIDGSQSKVEKGKFSSDEFLESQHLFMTMDFQFDGGDMRVDPSKLFVIVSIDTPIIGIIPHTFEQEFSGFAFDQMMQEDFKC